MLPSKGWLIALIALFSVGALALCCWNLDWAMYRDAVPPVEDETERLSETIKLEKLLIDSTDPTSSELLLKPGSKVEIQIIAAADTSKWRWSYVGNDSASRNARKREEKLPQAFVHLHFLRHSSVPPGEIVSSSCGSNPTRLNARQLKWTGKCRAPDASGTYLVRAFVEKTFIQFSRTGYRFLAGPENDRELLASFCVRVEP